MDVLADVKPNVLWPIMAFKRYILWSRDMMKSGKCCKPVLTNDNELLATEEEKRAIFRLYDYSNNTLQSCDVPLDSSVKLSREVREELWGRLVPSNLFDQSEINSALKETYRELSSSARPARIYARVIFTMCRHEFLRSLLLWLDVDEWVIQAQQCVERYRQLPEKPADEFFDVIVSAVAELERYQQIVDYLIGPPFLSKFASPGAMDCRETYYLHAIRQELAELPITCLRRICDQHLEGSVPFLDEQLRVVLKLLLSTHFSAAVRMDCIDLLTPENSHILVELAEDVHLALVHAEGQELLQYLLDHQRLVLNAVYGPLHRPQNIAVLLVKDALLGEGRAKRGMLSFLKRNKLRFSVDLPPRCYDEIRQEVENEMMCEAGGSGKSLEIVYWMVQFGYPLATQAAVEEFSYGISRRLKQPFTLLEQCIMGMVTAEVTHNRLVADGYMLDHEEDTYFGSGERAKRAALRFLIVENSPVPRPMVLRSLLDCNALTTLFAVVYYLFRAGRRVEFPIVPFVHSNPMALSVFPKTALLTRQIILRFGDTASCHARFLRKLELLGGFVHVEEKMTLAALALKAVHRNLRSDHRYARLRPDNYKKLRRQPVQGEVNLPLSSNMIPPAMIPLMNLEDVMESFRVEIREVGATRFADMKDRFHVFADCF